MLYVTLDRHLYGTCKCLEDTFYLVMLVLAFCLDIEIHSGTIGKTLEETVLHTIQKTLEKHDKGIITIFHGKGVSEAQLASMTESVETLGICAEIFTVPTDREGSDLTISFE